MDDCFWLFPATLQKLGTGNIAWKTSDEYSLSRNTNLKSTVEVYNIYIYIYIFSIWVFFNSAVYFFDVFTVFLSFVLFCLVAAYKKGLF